MKDVEELIKEIIKKTKDKQAKYMYGVEYSSDTLPNFRVTIKFSKDGVSPLLAGGTTKKELKKQLQEFIDGTGVKEIAVQYCLAQIHIEEEAIKFHQRLIEEYEATHS